jgi:putative Holliday junction resolvase
MEIFCKANIMGISMGSGAFFYKNSINFAGMGRIMAIDYGTKRVGLAVTDPLKIIANSLTTVHSKDVLAFLEDYFKKEQVECVVVGEPKTMQNVASSVTRHVEGFIKKLREKFPEMRIERMDERFTSQMAQQTMLMGGLKKKDRQNKETVDMVSATIILQSYMQSLEK